MKKILFCIAIAAIITACDKDGGIVKQPESVKASTWKADNGNITPRSDYFILWFLPSGEVTLSEAVYSARSENKFEYVFRNPLLGGEAYYERGDGSYSQKGKTITFNLTATGLRVPGTPSLGSHSITFTTGEIVGIANLVMDVNYTTRNESGEVSSGKLKFSRLYE